MRERTAEPSRIFSVYLPISLYEKLLDRAGKGRLNAFIKKLVENELAEKASCLGNAYKECYTNNPHLLKEAQLWEKAEIESWLNYEKSKNVAKKPSIKK